MRVKTYKVSFNSNGGSAVGTQEIVEGEFASKPSDPSKSGYTFVGWFSDEGLSTQFKFAKTAITADTTLYAKWTKNTTEYTVKFNTLGGFGIADQTVLEDACATLPSPAPTKKGYTFAGWFADEACTQAFNFATPITADITLYAKWDAENATVKTTHKVSFDAAGGTPVPAVQEVENGGKVKAPTSDPTKTGYTFLGWWLTDTDAFDFENMTISNDTLLTAHWAANDDKTPAVPVTTFTVTFNSNDGSAVGAQTVVKGEKAQKPADPTKKGYTFRGFMIEGCEDNCTSLSYAHSDKHLDKTDENRYLTLDDLMGDGNLKLRTIYTRGEAPSYSDTDAVVTAHDFILAKDELANFTSDEAIKRADAKTCNKSNVQNNICNRRNQKEIEGCLRISQSSQYCRNNIINKLKDQTHTVDSQVKNCHPQLCFRYCQNIFHQRSGYKISDHRKGQTKEKEHQNRCADCFFQILFPSRPEILGNDNSAWRM